MEGMLEDIINVIFIWGFVFLQTFQKKELLGHLAVTNNCYILFIPFVLLLISAALFQKQPEILEAEIEGLHAPACQERSRDCLEKYYNASMNVLMIRVRRRYTNYIKWFWYLVLMRSFFLRLVGMTTQYKQLDTLIQFDYIDGAFMFYVGKIGTINLATKKETNINLTGR